MPLALVTFAASVAFVPWLPSSAYVGRWAVLALATLLLFGRRVTMTPGHWCGLALIGWTVASLTWSVSPWSTAGALIQLYVLGSLFCVAAEADPEELSLGWFGLAAGVAVSALIGVGQWFDLITWHELNSSMVSGLFMNKNVLAGTCLLALVFAVNYDWWFFAVPLLVGAVLPDSRMGFVLLWLASSWGISRLCRHSWTVFGGLMGVVLLGVAVVVFTRHAASSSMNERLIDWQLAWFNLTWLGQGAGTYEELLPMFHYAHNEYLQSAFEWGVGALALGGLIAYALGGPKDEIEYAALLVILAWSTASYPLRTPIGLMVLALVAGRLCGARHRSCREERLRGDLGSSSAVVQRSEPSAEIQYAGPGSVVVPLRSQRARGGGAL